MTFLYVIVVVLGSVWLLLGQWFCSYFEGTLTLEEMEEDGVEKPCLPMNRHWGFISDIFLVTPFWIWFSMGYLLDLEPRKVYIAMFASLAFCIPLHNFWVRGSKVVYDPCGIEGKTTYTGWLHFMYMVPHFAAVFLFYTVTYVRQVELLVVTAALGVHVTVGMLQPEWYGQRELTGKGRIRGGVLIAWAVVLTIIGLFCRYSWLHNSRP